jgi:tripeptidyl-peptidase-1
MLFPIARSVVLALVVAARTTESSPLSVRSPYVVKDSHHVPKKWSNVGAAPQGHMIHLHIGLR